jgi:hypothetical protein
MRNSLLLLIAVLMAGVANAQVSVGIGPNVDRQPLWGPTGYDHVEYYYLPDIDSYYNVPRRQFYYFEEGRWISGSSLPPRYRGYDLYRSYKVVVNEPAPYRNDATYKMKYASFKGQRDQGLIRDSHDSRYFVNPNHPEHARWVKEQKHANGNGKNNGHGNSHGRK